MPLYNLIMLFDSFSVSLLQFQVSKGKSLETCTRLQKHQRVTNSFIKFRSWEPKTNSIMPPPAPPRLHQVVTQSARTKTKWFQLLHISLNEFEVTMSKLQKTAWKNTKMKMKHETWRRYCNEGKTLSALITGTAKLWFSCDRPGVENIKSSNSRKCAETEMDKPLRWTHDTLLLTVESLLSPWAVACYN